MKTMKMPDHLMPLSPTVYLVCWKWLCYVGSNRQISCNYFPGMWNPANGRCE